MPARKTKSTDQPAATPAAKRPAAKRVAAKTAAPSKPVATAKAVVAAKRGADLAVGTPKQKLVRDSFTIPKSEFEVLSALKHRAATLVRPTKKSELLRAGIALLNRLPDKAFLAALSSVPSLKTGRPTHAAQLDQAKVAKRD